MRCQKCNNELSENWRKEESHDGILIDQFCDCPQCQMFGKVVAMRHPFYKELMEKNG